MAERERERAELALGVGGVLNLQLSHRHNGQRWNARLIGFLEGESVLVTTPRNGGAPVPFYMDDELTVRYLAGREIHGFTTWIQKVATQPYPYLHLAFPKAIERVTIRQEERVPMDLPAKYQCLKQRDVAGDGHLLDLSAAGALLKAPNGLGEVGDELELQFDVSFAGSQTHIEVGAIIRNIKADEGRDADDEVKLYGLQFRDLSDQSRLFIKGFVYERIIEHRSG